MIKVILVCLVCIIGFILILNDFSFKEIKYEDVGMLIFECFLGGLLGTLLCACICVFSLKFNTAVTDKSIHTETLVSMNFDKDIKGEHFLGSGSINNVDYIMFLYKRK